MQTHDHLRKKATLPSCKTSIYKHAWRGYSPTSILESGLLPPSTGLCKSPKYARKAMHATSGYSVLKVLSLCKHFITLATVPGLHPPTSGVCSTCMGSLPNGTYQLPGDWYWKRSVLWDGKGLACETTWNLPRSLRNTSTLALERPVSNTHECASIAIFPAHNRPMEQLTSICNKCWRLFLSFWPDVYISWRNPFWR